jgi:hypothetical protein
LSFPDDDKSVAAADTLRLLLEDLGITVLPPPASDESSTSTSLLRPFYWLRQADAVVLDMTAESTWVVYDAGAAQALEKPVIPVAQSTDFASPIRWQLPRILHYESDQIGQVADFVREQLARSLRGGL